MKIKKCISLRKGYLYYTFYSELNELSNDVIETCKLLKKGVYIIEVFSKDPLNNMLISNATFLCTNGNFCYYSCIQEDFFSMIDFAAARHICICSLLEFDKCQVNANYLNDKFTFCICFENYLNTSKLIVCRKFYEEDIAQGAFLSHGRKTD